MSVVRKTVFAVALLTSGAAYAGTPGWSVSEASGPVFVSKVGLAKTSAVTRGAGLSEGDIISTGKGGRAVIVRGGEYLTVAPNTRLQLTEPKAGALTQIVQSFGNVLFKIQKKSTPHFQVNTPYLAAVVKGTTFSVTVTPAGASVQVTEGLVQVQSLDGLASRFVSPGEIGMIAASAPGQLSILGTPDAPAGGTTVTAPQAPATGPAAETPARETAAAPVAASVSDIADVRIASPIGEGNVNLAAQTGGIVSGNSSLSQSAMVEAVAEQQPAAVAAVDTAPPAPAEAPSPAEAPAVAAATPSPAPAPTAPAPVDVASIATPVTAPPAPVLESPVDAAPPPSSVAEAAAPVEPAAVATATPAPAPAPAMAPPVDIAAAAPPISQAPPVLADIPATAAPTPAVPEDVAIASPSPALPASLPPVADEAAPVLAMNTPMPAAAADTPAAVQSSAPLPPQVQDTPAATASGSASNASNGGASGSNNASGGNGSGSNSSPGGSGSQRVSNSGSGSTSGGNPTSLADFLGKLQDAVAKAQGKTKGN